MVHNISQAWRRWLAPNAHTREQWVRAQLRALPAGKKLLDAGAGQKPYQGECAHLAYFSQDFNQYEASGEGLQLKDWQCAQYDYVGDVWSIAAKDQSFDVILCTEVLEHIPYPNETLREFARLLKPGGVLLLTAPYACLPHMRPYFFYSGFSRDYYQTLLPQLGLTVESLQANGNYFLYLVQECLRGVGIVKNPLARALYALIMAVPVLWLRLLSTLVRDEQLVYGYHLRAVKHSRPVKRPRARPAKK